MKCEDCGGDIILETYQIVPCPSCNGKGEVYIREFDEYYSGYSKCYTCDGKKFVKMSSEGLKLYGG